MRLIGILSTNQGQRGTRLATRGRGDTDIARARLKAVPLENLSTLALSGPRDPTTR